MKLLRPATARGQSLETVQPVLAARTFSSAPRSPTQTRRRVLIVCTGRDRGALAAARSLHLSGWEVGVGTPEGGGMVGTSSAVSHRHTVPRPRGDGQPFIAAVRAAVKARGYTIVFGAGDDWMAAVSTYRDAIPALNPHPLPGVVTVALDKVALTAAATRVGISAPVTVDASPAAVSAWQGPVVIKTRAHWEPGQLRTLRLEAKTFPSIQAARRRIDQLQEMGARPILQEPVAGDLCALIGVFHAGRLRGRVQQDSLRLWPTPNGASARAVTVPVDEALAVRVENLLASIGWSGLVELQFLRDQAGEYHLIDLNGRFFGSLHLSEQARPGLTNLWARLTLGLTGSDASDLADGVPGARYAWMAGDLRRALIERRGGLLPDVVSTLAWGLRARHTVWQSSDPGPVLHLLRSRTGSARHGAAAGRFTE